jgi:hypothetical protein
MIRKANLYDDIFEYFQSTNYLNTCFSGLISCLINFLEAIIEQEGIDKDIICEDFPNTAKDCDHLEFNNPTQVISYVILHFLTRYQRSQELFLDLLKSRLFPLSSRENIVISIGAGPSPSLYAMNNFYSIINRFFESNIDNETRKITYRIDYCEVSSNFRQFLHHFTEYLNDERRCEKNNFYSIPYHFGSFEDFSKMIVSKNDNIRFNIAIFNNFLTPNTSFENFKGNIQGIIECLTNKGVLIIFGPDLKGKSRYRDYYYKLNKFLIKYRYKTKTKRLGYVKQVKFYESKKTIFNQNSIEILRKFYSLILKMLGSSSKLSQDFRNQFINKSKENPRIKDKWSAMIFQKRYIKQI